MLREEPVFSFETDKGDQWTVSLTYYDYALPLDNAPNGLPVEIYNILLDRESGSNVMPPRIRNEIALRLADALLRHPNHILTYLCSTEPLPQRNRSIVPQRFRSRLFSNMFARYSAQHPAISVSEKILESGEGPNTLIAHFLYHNSLTTQMEMLAALIQEDK